MLQEGAKIIDFALLDQDGLERKLSDYNNSRVLLYFYPKVDPANHALAILEDINKI